MPVNHDAVHKCIVVTTGGGTLALRIQYGGTCVVDQLFVLGTQVLADSRGIFTALDTGGARLASVGSAREHEISVDEKSVRISGVRFGNESLHVNEQWVFTLSDEHIRWSIERTYHGEGVADEVSVPLWNFPSLSTWTGAILGTGGVAWFRLFDTAHATYAVHTDSLTFWNADSGAGLRVLARPQQGGHVAVRFSRLPGDQVACSFAVTRRELVPRYDPEVHRRRYLTDREDVWDSEPVSGSISVEHELTAFDYSAEYDRGTIQHFDKKAMGTMMNTIARIGVIDRNLHGSNSWRTPFGPVCLHEQFIAQVGLALDGDEYLESYKQALEYYRDHAVRPDGRVKARWAYTCEDAMPGTCDGLGFYEARWGYLLDSNCDYVTNVAELFDLTGDIGWLRGQRETCRRALDFLLKRDTDGDGLVEMMTDSHTQKRGSDWIDVIWASHRNAFVNAKLYYALTLWSDVEELLGDPALAAAYRDDARRLKQTFNAATDKGGFWDRGNRWYVYWLDRDNSVHGNNLVTPVNFMAIAYGLCDDRERRSGILDRIESEMKKENLFAWPLCMFPFAEGEGMEFQYPFPNYENGDIFLAWGEVGVRAYASHDPRIAIKYIDHLLAKYHEDGLAFQRYSRVTQQGLGDDILANNCLALVGLYRNVYGIQPKHNRLYLEPHITSELDGTIVNYRRRGERCAIRLSSSGCDVSARDWKVASRKPFGVAFADGKLEYFHGRLNSPSLVLQNMKEVSMYLTIEEWVAGVKGVRKWTERSSSKDAGVHHRVFFLKPRSHYRLLRNGEAHRILSDDRGEIEFRIEGGYEGPQSFELRG